MQTPYSFENSFPINWSSLTDRERNVLLLIGQGHLDKEIAADLRIRLCTAITHKNRAFTKLGLHTRRDLFQFVAHYPHLFLPPGAGNTTA